ncbi:DUF3291 domain-containing protein [Marinoscillum furvescens]|uniref:Uncharacterized protein DUF3291 n=1 Tax=Marinoscillum furvescens DSM 4134 TaxID=1122208 RepID=A0A3D9L3S5_MARFU|nr:DUF3291 domain-containing protein [Marinoscillum furvescens]RED98338.1 uncharacterized protein DUF3291 [Marinoscillum furvescens DSM 4134]
MSRYQLAQINVAVIKGENMNDPVMKEFMDNLESVYQEAETSPGYVWRLEEDPDAPEADDKTLINITVWENVESLKNFTFSNLHGKLLRRRKEWFVHLKEVYTALWWIEEGNYPKTSEALNKLTFLRDKGPSAEAFGFKDIKYHDPLRTS